MNKNYKAKIVVFRSLTTAVALALGLLISAQWNSIPERVVNPIAPYSSLKETKESLYEEQDQLKQEIKKLQTSIEKAQKDNQSNAIANDELSNLENQKSKSGLTKLNGPGLVITYDDSGSTIVSDESIVHAPDLRDTVNLLWSTGAEAISINRQRVVINTAIDCIGNTILINNVRISNPFSIEVIGNQDLMYRNLSDPGVLKDIHQRHKSQGLVFTFIKNNNITVPAFDGSFEVKTREST